MPPTRPLMGDSTLRVVFLVPRRKRIGFYPTCSRQTATPSCRTLPGAGGIETELDGTAEHEPLRALLGPPVIRRAFYCGAPPSNSRQSRDAT